MMNNRVRAHPKNPSLTRRIECCLSPSRDVLIFIKSLLLFASSEKEKTIGSIDRYASPVTKSHARRYVSTSSSSSDR